MKEQEPLIVFQATINEMIALGSAINGYIALLYRTVPPSKERSEVINTLNTFRQRVIDTLLATIDEEPKSNDK